MLNFVLIGVVIIIIIVIAIMAQNEHFTTRREKAEAIAGWLATDSSPTYSEFAKKFPASDIVDYHNVRKTGAQDINTIEKVVS